MLWCYNYWHAFRLEFGTLRTVSGAVMQGLGTENVDHNTKYKIYHPPAQE